MNEKKISLDGQWNLFYALETNDMQDGCSYLREYGSRINANVPGNIEIDLYNAGIEPDPFYAENLYLFRKYEFYRWQFERTFNAPEKNDSKWSICFGGLNCFADIYINDKKVGSAANAMIEHEFDVTPYIDYGCENSICVVIKSAANVARSLEIPMQAYTHETGGYQMLRMPPSSFGWDILGRFVSAGMWRSVEIREVKPTRIVDAYFATRSISPDGTAHMRMRYRWDTDAPILEGFTLELDACCGSQKIHKESYLGFVDSHIDFDVPDAQLWWPRGYGDPNLYVMKLTLKYNGEVCDCREWSIGIRKLEIEHKMLPGDEGEFKVIANGCPVFCKGSNWVPLDVLHSRDIQRVERAIDLVVDSGCNILRCWGGNTYEDHIFFDLCDRNGIMVWQDFALACCIYCEKTSFLKEIETEALSVVRKLRNHASILLWAGDNEIDYYMEKQDYASTVVSDTNVISRQVLPHAVRMEDPYRFYLPSSPYISCGLTTFNAPEQHNWGPRAYFKDDFYRNSQAHFISETGYHGCPSVVSLKKYIPDKDLNNWLNNGVWDAHNTDYVPFGVRGYNRIELMHDQVDMMFGYVPKDIEKFSVLSQIVQAEAFKFFIEHSRVLKWRRTGIIWWNILDGWPQISDAVVDYYFDKKLAYYYIKRVQEPVAVIADERDGWQRSVVLCNESRKTCIVSWTVENGETGDIIAKGETVSPANENVTLCSFKEIPSAQKLYVFKWKTDESERVMSNHCISGFPAYDEQKMLEWVRIIQNLPEKFNFLN